MNKNLLRAKDVVRLFGICPTTVDEWVQLNRIPYKTIDGEIWFHSADVEECMRGCFEREENNDEENGSASIAHILSVDRIIYPKHGDKTTVLTEIAHALAQAPQIKKRSELVDGILQRESMLSTAIGCGIAIPHVRLDSVTSLVMAVGICSEPIEDFQAIDTVPVQLVFMVAAATSQHAVYLRTISFLCDKLKNPFLRQQLLSTHSAEEVYAVLTEPAC